MHVILDNLKSSKIARDSQHFEGKSTFCKSGERGGHNREKISIDF